ncbi:hypothetical protein AGMMS49992_06190 [Clostridia bacterium]|nr:hypothetical protein AGMMS49992_06190 [Clostridia bacterium]
MSRKKIPIVFASRNKGKAREVAALLGKRFRLITMDEAGFHDEIVEDGITFIDNAIIKAETVCKALYRPVLADDSGLMVDALDGAPGVYSARYAGNHGNDAANNALLLSNLSDEPAPRRARFVCALALARPEFPTYITEGYCKGEIGFEPDGQGGFGYDPLFYVNGISLARMTDDEKNRISHRAMACHRMRVVLSMHSGVGGKFQWKFTKPQPSMAISA